MIKIDSSRTFREILVRNVGKTLKVSIPGKCLVVTIVSVGADCIQVDKMGKNIIPISAIIMISR